MKIVSLGGVCLFPEHIKQLEECADLVLYEDTPTSTQIMIDRMADANIIIVSLSQITKEIIDANDNLNMICLATTGCDNVDLSMAAAKNLTVCYAPGYATRTVAEHAIGLMIAAGRLTFTAANDVKQGLYNPCSYQGKELHGKTLGIIGFGRIGREVAGIAQAGLDMRVISYDIDASQEVFETLLKESDFISLHVPLTPATHHMLGEKEFALMKKGVVIVNTARGDLIDERALIANLKSGNIFAAGLDVLKDEPIKKDNPILSLPNVIVTPHIGFNGDQAIFQRSKIVTDNILSFLDGKPQNIVELCR